MKVELDKKDIISLIRGEYPSYEQIDMLVNRRLGTYTGGFADRWDWNSKHDPCWNAFSEEELYDMYLTLKQ